LSGAEVTAANLSASELLERFRSKSPLICVIGPGYVGLPPCLALGEPDPILICNMASVRD
jgi:hypothetical protein